jgi:arylsulfatase A-like enzyme
MSFRVPAAILAVATLLAAAGCAPRPSGPPNIVVILVDTLRADHLGVTGFRGGISPNLDRLAAESVLFENCYAQAPWTPPSMGTLFTSLYPEVHGLNNFRDQMFKDPSTRKMRASVLPDSAVTLAELLQDGGHETAAFVTNPWLAEGFGLSQGFDHYDDRFVARTAKAESIRSPVRDWLTSRSDDAPFFLYLHFMDVHEPYDAPQADYLAMRDHVEPGAHVLSDEEVPPDAIEIRPAWADEEMRHDPAYWRGRYASGVHAFDRRFAEFLEMLEEFGLMDNSFVVVTSDHGEELWENGRWGHGNSLYEHQLRVPLLIRQPGGEGGGRRVSEMVGLIDLMPTLLSLAGVESPDILQGEDFSSLLVGGGPVERPEVSFGSSVMWGPGVYSVRTGRHKLIVGPSWIEFFDLVLDPREQDNLAGRDEELQKTMRQLLNTHLVAIPGRLESEQREVSEELLERLRSLGYVD